MRWLWRLLLASLFLLTLAAIAALFHGPLFAWSPVTPGFERVRDGRMLFMHRSEHPLTPAHRLVGHDIATLESALGLGLPGDVTVVLCDEWDDFRRFTPWLPESRGVGAHTVEFGTVVYLTPLVRDRADITDLLRHELVHVLLLRRTPLRARSAVTHHWWIVEGLAVRYGNPSSYPLPDHRRIMAIEVVLPSLLDQPLDARYGNVTISERFALAGGFIAYLEQVYHRRTVQKFLRAYVNDPDAWAALFERTFLEPFDDVVAAFGRSLQEEPDPSVEPMPVPDPDEDPDDWIPP